jgi:hypothetical protein
MSIRSFTLAATASLAIAFLSQESVEAGFLVAHGDAWHSVGDDVGSGPTAPETNRDEKAKSSAIVGLLSRYLTQDAAHFGRIGCSAPGGMSNSPTESSGLAGPMFLVGSRVFMVDDVQSSIWVRMEEMARPPQPLSTGILRPPRRPAVVG